MIRVYVLADIVKGTIKFRSWHRDHHQLFNISDFVASLSHLRAVVNPASTHGWIIELVIGQGMAARQMSYNLEPVIPKSYNEDAPLLVLNRDKEGKEFYTHFVYFRDRLFVAERLPENPSRREEITLRVKLAAYAEDAGLSHLRTAVMKLEKPVGEPRPASKKPCL